MLTMLPFIIYVSVFIGMCLGLIVIVHRAITAEEARQVAHELRAQQSAPLTHVLDRAA